MAQEDSPKTLSEKTIYEGGSELAPPSYASEIAKSASQSPENNSSNLPPSYKEFVKDITLPKYFSKWSEQQQKINEKNINNLVDEIQRVTSEYNPMIGNAVKANLNNKEKFEQIKSNITLESAIDEKSRNTQIKAQMVQDTSERVMQIEGITNQTKDLFQSAYNAAEAIKSNSININQINIAEKQNAQEFQDILVVSNRHINSLNQSYKENVQNLEDIKQEIKIFAKKGAPPSYIDASKESKINLEEKTIYEGGEIAPPPQYSVKDIKALPVKDFSKAVKEQETQDEKKIDKLVEDIKSTFKDTPIINDIIKDNLENKSKLDQTKIAISAQSGVDEKSFNIQTKVQVVQETSDKVLSLKGISQNTGHYFQEVNNAAEIIKNSVNNINDIKAIYDQFQNNFKAQFEVSVRQASSYEQIYQESLKTFESVKKDIKKGIGTKQEAPPSYNETIEYKERQQKAQSANLTNSNKENQSIESNIQQSKISKMNSLTRNAALEIGAKLSAMSIRRKEEQTSRVQTIVPSKKEGMSH